MHNTMQPVRLNNGVNMPVLGNGAYQMEDQPQCEQAVVDAIQAGYRLIDPDAACHNEESV